MRSVFSVASALLLAPAALRGRGAPGHPLEPLARPGHRRGLVLDRAVLRRQDDARPGFEQVAIAIGANYNLTGEGRARSGWALSASPRTCCQCWGRGRGCFSSGPWDDLPGSPVLRCSATRSGRRRYGGDLDRRLVRTPSSSTASATSIVGLLQEEIEPPRARSYRRWAAPEHAEVELPHPLAPEGSPRLRSNREDEEHRRQAEAGCHLCNQAQARDGCAD